MSSSAAILAIIGMGLATYATRLSGFYLLRGLNVSGPLKAALDALPPAVLMAVIAPVILTTGLAETIAAAITALAGFFRLPLAVTILIGIVSVVLLRWAFQPG
ncbi:AzlD family protein [Aestuariivirga sp.]|uniref:AzlD family protein n=1 Tax=Aestuariivirga sp. TaxID=2650926 RepID=UPI003BAA5104